MSLSMCCLASGSKGNCTFVSDGTTNILIDLGVSATYAEKCLAALGVDAGNLDIFVTHSHSDHINGIKTFCKHHPGVAVHCQRESARAVANSTGVSPVIEQRSAGIGGLMVYALPVPHDVACFGYVVHDNVRSVAVVTDIGAVKPDILNALGGCDIVMLESNHDCAMLRANPNYSYPLKMRIASPHGHLSNADCAAACSCLAADGVKNFILAHLSEENNTPELAVAEVLAAMQEAGICDVHVTVATQNAMTGLFEVC